MKFLSAFALLFLIASSTAAAQTKSFSPLVPRDNLEYIVVLESGDRFRGNVIASGDTFQIKTEFDIIRVPKNMIKEFIPITFPRDTYLHRSQHFLMPTASPAGPGFSLTNYELGFLYATFGLGYGATINAGATIVPTVSLKSQLYHVNAKFTVEREKDLEFAVGGAYTFFTTDHPYAHIYGVGTFALGTGRYSAMIFYKAAGDEQSLIIYLGRGRGYRSYPKTLCASVNEQVVHGIPSKRKLKGGDIIGLDLGAVVGGFYGDSAMTVAVGEVSESVARLIQVTQEALDLGLQKAVVGNRLTDISYAVQRHVEAAGYSVVTEFVGHGIGRQLHEEPQVPNYGKAGHGPRLQYGMVLAIEPMVNMGGSAVRVLEDRWTAVTADGSLSAHFEHTIAIQPTGPARVLSQRIVDSP